MTPHSRTRRDFLRGAGVSLALPLLESFSARAAAPQRSAPPRRMVAVCFSLGLHGPNLFPTASGFKYAPTPYLQALTRRVQNQFTVVSGLCHPGVLSGHSADASFLTGAQNTGSGSFRNSISLDQFLVENQKLNTRFPFLALATRDRSLSFSRNGVEIPADSQPSKLYSKLFVDGTKSQAAAQVHRLAEEKSVLDTVLAPAKQLRKRVSAADRDRLDQYFTAVREVEQDLVNKQEWAKKPKPRIKGAPPQDVDNPNDDIGRLETLLAIVMLALQTDSTRCVTLYHSPTYSVLPIAGVTMACHTLSHHSHDPERLAQLLIVETRQMECVGKFLNALQRTNERDETLLNRTAVLVGSAMGNASSHSNKNLPIVLAGGGFKHGQHLAFDQEKNMPLGRLFVSLLQRMGAETDQFAGATGTLPGLDLT